MTYAVLSHRMCHLLKIQEDKFDIMFQATPVCKVQTGKARTITSNLPMDGNRNLGLQP